MPTSARSVRKSFSREPTFVREDHDRPSPLPQINAASTPLRIASPDAAVIEKEVESVDVMTPRDEPVQESLPTKVISPFLSNARKWAERTRQLNFEQLLLSADDYEKAA
jgi:hypothetical protein